MEGKVFTETKTKIDGTSSPHSHSLANKCSLARSTLFVTFSHFTPAIRILKRQFIDLFTNTLSFLIPHTKFSILCSPEKGATKEEINF